MLVFLSFLLHLVLETSLLFSIRSSPFLLTSHPCFSISHCQRAICQWMQGSPRCEHEAPGSTDPVPLRQSHAFVLEATVGYQ